MHDTLVVEVFKTNIQNSEVAASLLDELGVLYPDGKFNFALDDCDRILRADCARLDPAHIISLLEDRGFQCSVLE